MLERLSTTAWYVSAASPTAPNGSKLSRRLRPRPITRKPNRIALGMLVSRATTATENVSMPKKMIRVGSSTPCGMIRPVSAARVQPSDHATCDTRLESMAASSASSRRSTTARIDVPRNVRWKRRYSATATARTVRNSPTCSVSKMSDPTVIGDCPNRRGTGSLGVPCTPGPHTTLISASSTTVTPRAATSFSELEALRSCSGRNTSRSRTSPMSGPQTRRTTGTTSTSGTPHRPLSCQPRYPASRAMAKWAMLKTPVAVYVRTMPVAESA